MRIRLSRPTRRAQPKDILYLREFERIKLGGTAEICSSSYTEGRRVFCLFSKNKKYYFGGKMKRTIYCGLVREEHNGTYQTCTGWVLNKRDMGGVIFIDLRDREGVLQVVFDARNLSKEDFSLAESLRSQSVIGVSGYIRKRDEETYNPKIASGTVELAAEELYLYSSADTLPFSPEDGTPVREDLRLKYRFIDIRRPQMTNLRYRTEFSGAEDFPTPRDLFR